MSRCECQTGRWNGRSARCPARWMLAAVTLVAGAVGAGPAPGQEDGAGASASGITLPDPAKAPWLKFEAAIEKSYREPLKQGGAFEPPVKEYLQKNVVPQLALEDNRAIIDRVRKRMRDLLLGGIADDKSFESASAAALESMDALARDGQEPLAVRVNAMLFIGEMRQKDNREGKVWPKAADALAKAAADRTLPPAVRVAAMAGLARQADTAKAAGDARVTEFTRAARGALQGILGEKPEGSDAVAVDWLAARALAMLPGLTKNTSKELAGAVAVILADESRPIDVRVRAAAALGAIAGPKSEVDPIAQVKTIRALAVESLGHELATADRQRFEDDYRAMAGGRRRFAPKPVAPAAGGAAFGGYDPSGVGLSLPTPGFPSGGSSGESGATLGGGGYPGLPGMSAGPNDPVADYVTEPACRRIAWRLHALGDAVVSEKGTGIGSLPGAEADADKELAELLREQAATIADELTEKSVRDALAALQGKEDAAADSDTPDAKPGAKPATKPGDNEPDESSPFGK